MICGIGSNSSISEAWCGRGCGWLLIELRDGGTKTAKGHTRRAWSARSLNAAIDAWRLVLAYGCDRRDLAHNVAAPMHKVARVRREMATYTPEEIGLVLRAADKDRNGRLWYLALSGLRRGEIAGLCGRYQLRNRHAQDRAQPGSGGRLPRGGRRTQDAVLAAHAADGCGYGLCAETCVSSLRAGTAGAGRCARRQRLRCVRRGRGTIHAGCVDEHVARFDGGCRCAPRSGCTTPAIRAARLCICGECRWP